MSDVKNKRVHIYIDHGAAEAALVSLNATADRLNKTIDKGRTAGKDMTAELAKLDKVKANIKGVQDQIDKGFRPSLAQTQTIVIKLRNELRKMSEDAPGYADKFKAYQKASAELNRMQSAIHGINNAQGEMVKGSSRLTQAGVAFGSFIGTIGANLIQGITSGVGQFFSDSVEEAKQAEMAVSRLRNTLDNLGETEVFDSLVESADELAEKFKYLDNDEILEGFQQLITYGKLTKNQIDDLMPVIIDFAAKNNTSINESASISIKAMEGNSRALKDYGISVKEGSTVTERFGIIMDQLKPKVEGAAAAVGTTLTGEIRIAEQGIDDLKEEIGGQLMPVVSWFYRTMHEALDGFGIMFNTIKTRLAEIGRVATTTFSVLKNIATLDTQGALNAVAQYNAQKVMQEQQLEMAKRRAEIEREATSAGNVAKTKTWHADRFKMLSEENELLRASAANYKVLREEGKAQTKQGKDALLQLEKDAARVAAIKKVIDEKIAGERVLGLGDPSSKKPNTTKDKKNGEDELERKAKADLARLREQMAKLEDQLGLENLTQYQKELEKVRITYMDLWKDLVATKKDTDADHVRLANLRSQAEEAIYDKMVADAQAFIDERNLKLDQGNKTSYQLEIEAINKAFDARVKLYKGQTEQLRLLQEQRNKELEIAAQQNLVRNTAPRPLNQKGTDEIDKEKQEKLRATIDLYLEYANQAMNILDNLANAQNNRENAALNRELRANDVKKAAYKKQLDGKMISEGQYRKRVAELDAEADAKKLALEKKQFERGKRMQIAQALISGALAITSTLAARPGATDIISLGLFRAIQIGIAVATTAAQVATIASQKFAKGGKLTGPSHANGGMPVINPVTGRKEAEVEGGEYILSKATVANNRSIADALLDASMNRGGASINQPWENRPYKSINYTTIKETMHKVKYETGGIILGTQQREVPRTETVTDPLLINTLNQMQQVNASLMQTIIDLRRDGIAANISLNKLDEASAQRERIYQDAALK